MSEEREIEAVARVLAQLHAPDPEIGAVSWTYDEIMQCPELAGRLHRAILDLRDENERLRGALAYAFRTGDEEAVRDILIAEGYEKLRARLVETLRNDRSGLGTSADAERIAGLVLRVLAEFTAPKADE